jgi:NAD(P)-dependent dehydrogenase (short-subunit alcohol dehydrogenase family)
VTGSSRGLGRAIARGIQAAGGEVVFHGDAGRPPDVPASAPYLAGDLLAAEFPETLVREAFQARPNLALLVCNAGSFFDRDFLQMDLPAWERTMNLNVRATYFVVQAFARELTARQRAGAIVIVASTNGFQSEEESTAYDTSKGALVMMIRSLAQALAPHRIRVNGLAPGLIRTPLTAPWLDTQPEKRRHYEKKILQARIGEPDDCAGPAVFLLSPAAAYVTGQIVVVDGGLTVGQIGRM